MEDDEYYAFPCPIIDLLLAARIWPEVRTLRLCRNRLRSQPSMSEHTINHDNASRAVQDTANQINLGFLPDEVLEQVETFVYLGRTKQLCDRWPFSARCHCKPERLPWRRQYVFDAFMEFCRNTCRNSALQFSSYLGLAENQNIAISRLRRVFESTAGFQTLMHDELQELREGGECQFCTYWRDSFWQQAALLQPITLLASAHARDTINSFLDEHNLVLIRTSGVRVPDNGFLSIVVGIQIKPAKLIPTSPFTSTNVLTCQLHVPFPEAELEIFREHFVMISKAVRSLRKSFVLEGNVKVWRAYNTAVRWKHVRSVLTTHVLQLAYRRRQISDMFTYANESAARMRNGRTSGQDLDAEEGDIGFQAL